jgi:hypothetical protein
MADLAYRRDAPIHVVTDWGAIWAGTFAFYAIWFVFGTLGLACFGSADYRGVWGYGVWGIVLNVIAMYVAGRTTGSNASVTRAGQGLRHGLYMFGLANVGVVLLVAIGYAIGRALAAGTAQVQSGFSYAGYLWPVWIAMFLGWIAAMTGATQGAARHQTEIAPLESEREPVSIRPAA